MRFRVDGLTLVAVILLLFMGFNILRDQEVLKVKAAPGSRNLATVEEVSDSFQSVSPTQNLEDRSLDETSLLDINLTPEVIVSPYDEFILTQGLHGFAYGHAAIDISGGKNALIKSPINGVVSAKYIDEWGNTTLILDNERYQVLMLHGNYSVEVGEQVTAGQTVGVESNQGNTFDMNGHSCRGRDCGYHTHLNIYDKSLGLNVDPLPLIENK